MPQTRSLKTRHTAVVKFKALPKFRSIYVFSIGEGDGSAEVLLLGNNGHYACQRVLVYKNDIEKIRQQTKITSDMRLWPKTLLGTFLLEERAFLDRQICSLLSWFPRKRPWIRQFEEEWAVYVGTVESFVAGGKNKTDNINVLKARRKILLKRILPHQYRLSRASRRHLERKEKMRNRRIRRSRDGIKIYYAYGRPPLKEIRQLGTPSKYRLYQRRERTDASMRLKLEAAKQKDPIEEMENVLNKNKEKKKKNKKIPF